MAGLPDVLRRISTHPRVLPTVALALRARTVRTPVRFALRELSGRRRLDLYRLRGAEATVGVRHGTGDVVTLGELFHEHDYEPPAAVASALDRTAEPRILDLGANVGMFGAWALARWPSASVDAFEPDPQNAAVHARAAAANGHGDRWRLHRAAAGTAPGSARFVAGDVALSRLAGLGAPAGEGQTIEVPVRDVLPLIAGADLVKLDVEGAEWPLLADPRFAADPPRAVTMEYHPEGAPAGADPAAAARALLEAAGLHVEDGRRTSAGTGQLWAWRSA